MPQLSWEETRSIMAEVQELFAGREVRLFVFCSVLIGGVGRSAMAARMMNGVIGAHTHVFQGIHP